MKIVARPLDPAPGGLMVVRAYEALDNLDQVRAPSIPQR
jgi:hypothetical protein